jgi:Gpi18-like mannosyltransferase
MLGQTEYINISSIMGACFYPAGHLWHYAPIFKLLQGIAHSTLCLKIFHLILHTVSILVVSKVAFNYFKQDPSKAQLMVFLFLANHKERCFEMWMYNDSIMVVYVLLCLYMVSENKPRLAALMFSLALSIKAGAMLLLPTLLGSI